MTDRPWLAASGAIATSDEVRAWRNFVGIASPAGRPAADRLRSGISVVIPSHNGRAWIERCLRSLCRQNLDARLYEIVVVFNGSPDGSEAIVRDIRSATNVSIRTVSTSRAGAAHARNLGIATAAHEFTTFVDDDDEVSPAFLSALLSHAQHGVVTLSGWRNVHADGTSTGGYLGDSVARFAGREVAPHRMLAAAMSNAGKAVSTALLRTYRYDEDLDSGEDVVLWATVFATNNLMLRPCADGGAIYYRQMREGSLSRRELSFDFAVRQRLDVIERLDRLAEMTDGDVRTMVVTMIEGQVSFIRRYLDAHPEDRPRVVAAADERPILNFPFERLPAPESQRLVIAYAFPPHADTSATVMAKRVRMDGRIADVVSNDMGRIRSIDDSLRRLSGPFVKRHAMLPTPTWFADFGSMESFARAGLALIDEWIAERGGHYPEVFSRAQFAASHFLAACYKLSSPSTRWVAEFSDPLSRDVKGEVRGNPVRPGELISRLTAGLQALGLPVPPGDNTFVWCEEIAYALADDLVFTNTNQLDYMLSYCSDPDLAARARAKATLSPQPTLPARFYHLTRPSHTIPPGKVHIAYFGNFYANRGLDDVLFAMSQLDDDSRSRIMLHVFTNKSDELERRAAELRLTDSVQVGPYLAYLVFLNLATRFDCLIVNDAVTRGVHGRNPYLPSKWSDYRGAGVPVWGLIEPGSPLSSEQVTYRSHVGVVGEAVEVLAKLLEQAPECRT